MIDIEKFICSLLADHPVGVTVREDIHKALKDQGLEYKGGKIVEITPKQEQKFKAGDWVVSPNGVYWHIDAIRDGRYQVSSNSGECTDWSLYTNIYHKFTIQDAKDGDILASCGDENPFIFKGCIDTAHPNAPVAYCGIDAGNDFCDCTTSTNWWTGSTVRPATEEQRDLLFQKMKEAGYEWDAEKKELKKIEQKEVIHNRLTDFELSLKHVMEEAIECGDTHNLKADADMLLRLVQNSAWNEEDEEILEDIRFYFELNKENMTDALIARHERFFDKIKSLKPQQKREWNEEDEVGFGDAMWAIEQAKTIAKDENDMGNLWCAERWLKSLKARCTWKPSDLPHWKKSTLPDDDTTGFNSVNFYYGGYYINYRELFDKLPKDN